PRNTSNAQCRSTCFATPRRPRSRFMTAPTSESWATCSAIRGTRQARSTTIRLRASRPLAAIMGFSKSRVVVQADVRKNDRTNTMRAVIYARYSSDLQRDASIEDQVRVCRRRIDAEGWSLQRVYSDHGASGASHLRAGYQALLQDARSQKFDVVVAESLDRLSRDQEHVAGLYKQLSFHGVLLLTIGEGEISELHVGLKGAMSALYLKDLAQKTRRGLEGRVRQGRELDPQEADGVRSIFTAFAAGKSPRAIAKDLNDRGVPGPRG